VEALLLRFVLLLLLFVGFPDNPEDNGRSMLERGKERKKKKIRTKKKEKAKKKKKLKKKKKKIN
jgi:hypothetical protein